MSDFLASRDTEARCHRRQRPSSVDRFEPQVAAADIIVVVDSRWRHRQVCAQAFQLLLQHRQVGGLGLSGQRLHLGSRHQAEYRQWWRQKSLAHQGKFFFHSLRK